MEIQQPTTEDFAFVPIETHKLPKWRLFSMRGLYLLTFIGLAYDNWLTIFNPIEPYDAYSGVAISFWAAYSLLMGIGVRYPIKMIPLLLLQLIYKSAWIIGTYLPAKSAGLLNEDLELFYGIFIKAIILDFIVIPWPYVYKNYIKDFFKFKAL